MPEPREPPPGLLRRRRALDTPVYEREPTCRRAFAFEGPAIIDQLDSTTLVPPGVKARGRRVPQHPHPRRRVKLHADQTAPLDPVTFEVLKNSFVTIVDQMAEQILRTCHSFVIYTRDFSCALHDADGNTIMQGSQDIAVHVGTLHFTCKAVIEDFEGDIHDGDVFAINDPYCGGTHFNDVRLIRPIFADGELIAFAQSNGHWADVGGSRSPARSTSAPPTSSARASASRRCACSRQGRFCDDVARLIASNTRARRRSSATSTRRSRPRRCAERELLRLIEKYGVDDVVTGVRARCRTTSSARPASASPSCPTARGRPRTTSTSTRRRARA